MITDKHNKPIKKFEPEPEQEVNKQVVPSKPKTSLKRKAVKAVILLALAMGLLLTAVYGVDYYFDRNTINWQSPIKLQVPVFVTPRTQAQEKQVEVVATTQAAETTAAVVAPEPPKPSKITTYDNAQLLAAVYQLESSSGKHDGCKAKGKFNGFGYAQSTHTWNCFDTFEEVENKVSAWFEKRVPTMGLSTALCYYNTGYKTADCPYYQEYLKIKK